MRAPPPRPRLVFSCATHLRPLASLRRPRTTFVDGTEYQECQGFLFKLKENNKEWKKLYVALSANEIIYYNSPQDATADRRQKDGVKQVVSAYPYDEFSGVNAPTGTPAYLCIETTHAKKVYCAKSQDVAIFEGVA